MITFTPLASSSDGCAYKVSAPGAESLLIDCGLRFAEIQKALKFQVSALAGCLVSHAHGDHSKAIPDLLKAGVEVYASEGTWRQVAKGEYGSHHRANTLRTQRPVLVAGDWSVIPFDAVHDCEGTMGFSIAREADRLIYLTDTAYALHTFPGVSILAIECNWGEEQMRESARTGRVHAERFRRTAATHMSLERLLRMLDHNQKEGYLSNLRETHLLHLSDENSDEAAFKEAVQKATGKPVYVAEKRAVGA